MHKPDTNAYLKIAMITGTVSILYAVCTLDIFLVIAMICSWTAFWSNNTASRKKTARIACIMYIISIIWSVFMSIVMIRVGNVFTGLDRFIIAMSVIFCIIIAVSALCSFRAVTVKSKETRPAVEYYSGGTVRKNDAP